MATPYDAVSVSFKGFVSFTQPGSGSAVAQSTCLPTAALPNDAIYVLWQNWLTSLGGQVYVQYPDADRFVVTWAAGAAICRRSAAFLPARLLPRWPDHAAIPSCPVTGRGHHRDRGVGRHLCPADRMQRGGASACFRRCRPCRRDAALVAVADDALITGFCLLRVV